MSLFNIKCLFGYHDDIASEVWVDTWRCRRCKRDRSLLLWGCYCR